MPIDFIKPTVTFVLGVLLSASGFVPGLYFVNRLFRDEPVKWETTKAVAFMLFAVLLSAGALTINGISASASNVSFQTVSRAFLFGLIACLIYALSIGILVAYPLHRYIEWQEPPDIIQRYE